MHECNRVYRDKLVEQRDIDLYDKIQYDAVNIQYDAVKKCFEDYDDNLVFRQPLLYCHFAAGIGDSKYQPVTDYAEVRRAPSRYV